MSPKGITAEERIKKNQKENKIFEHVSSFVEIKDSYLKEKKCCLAGSGQCSVRFEAKMLPGWQSAVLGENVKICTLETELNSIVERKINKTGYHFLQLSQTSRVSVSFMEMRADSANSIFLNTMKLKAIHENQCKMLQLKWVIIFTEFGQCVGYYFFYLWTMRVCGFHTGVWLNSENAQ